MVHTGGCRGAQSYYCAINEDSCGEGSRYGGVFLDPEYFQFKTGMNCRLCQPTANTADEKDGFDNDGVNDMKKINDENESGTDESGTDETESGTDEYGTNQSGGVESAVDETRVQSTSANEKANATVQTTSNNTPVIALGVLVGILSVGLTVMSVLYVRKGKQGKAREIEVGSLQSVN